VERLETEHGNLRTTMRWLAMLAALIAAILLAETTARLSRV
jgi:hypothetical protein